MANSKFHVPDIMEDGHVNQDPDSMGMDHGKWLAVVHKKIPTEHDKHAAGMYGEFSTNVLICQARYKFDQSIRPSYEGLIGMWEEIIQGDGIR